MILHEKTSAHSPAKLSFKPRSFSHVALREIVRYQVYNYPPGTRSIEIWHVGSKKPVVHSCDTLLGARKLRGEERRVWLDNVTREMEGAYEVVICDFGTPRYDRRDEQPRGVVKHNVFQEYINNELTVDL